MNVTTSSTHNALYFESLVAAGLSRDEAARCVDWGIAYDSVKRRLQREGIDREPLDSEVERALAQM